MWRCTRSVYRGVAGVFTEVYQECIQRCTRSVYRGVPGVCKEVYLECTYMDVSAEVVSVEVG